MVQSFGLSDPGLVRASNQDRILIDDAHGLYLIADGVGGHSHGEAAAELAVNTGQYFVQNSEEAIDASWPFGYDINRSVIENRLLSAIHLANRQLCIQRPKHRSGRGRCDARSADLRDRPDYFQFMMSVSSP